VSPVATGKKLKMGVVEIFFIIYFWIMKFHVILPNNT